MKKANIQEVINDMKHGVYNFSDKGKEFEISLLIPQKVTAKK